MTEKIHWAKQRRLDREAAIAAGLEPPPWPTRKPSAPQRRNARLDAQIEKDKITLAPKSKDFFEGLTGGAAGNCCDACREGYCVISQDMFCVHPEKTGLGARHRMKPDVMRRFDQAKKHLEHLKVEKRQH